MTTPIRPPENVSVTCYASLVQHSLWTGRGGVYFWLLSKTAEFVHSTHMVYPDRAHVLHSTIAVQKKNIIILKCRRATD